MFLRESNRSTALKTLALRVRGAKVELQDASLDIDGMAESTSQLQAKLLALTHGKVDIMLDKNTFKSTTQILREIAGVWQELTDIERAGALELLGGKRQANILASLINNFDIVEDVIQTSINSQNSALKENEKYLDSITGRIEVFKNTAQTMWMDTLDSDFIKGLVDIGTELIKIIDKVGVLQTLLMSIGSIAIFRKRDILFPAIKELFGQTSQVDKIANAITNVQNVMNSGKASIDAYAQAVKGLDAAEQAQILTEQGLTQAQVEAVLAKNNMTDASVAQTNASREAAAANTQEAAASATAAAGDTAEAAASNASTEADIAEAAASDAATAADTSEAAASAAAATSDVAEAAASAANGLEAAATGAAKASGAFGKVSSAGSKVVGAFGKIGTGIGIAITAFTIITTIIHAYKQAQEEARQATISAGNEFNQTASSIESYKSRITELKKSLESGNLSEQEAYDARKQLLSIQGEMVDVFGNEAGAVDILRGSIEDCNAAFDTLSQKQAQINLAENSEQIAKATKNIEEVKDWMSGTGGIGWSDANPELTKRLESIVSKYDNAEIKYGQKNANGGQWMTLHVTANAEEAEETFAGLSADFKQLEQEMDININEALGMEGAQSWDSRFQRHIEKTNEVLDNWQEIYDNSTLWEIAANDDYSNMVQKFADAKTQLEEAIASGNDIDLNDAFANFDDVKLQFQTILDDPNVPQKVKDYIQDISDNIETASKASKVELELETEFKDPDSQIKEKFDDILQGLVNDAGQRLDMTGILDVGLQYDNDMNRASIAQNNEDTAAFKDIMNGLTDQEMAYGRLKNVANEYGVEVEDLLNILVRLGEVDPGEGVAEQMSATITTLDKMKSSVESYATVQQIANELAYDGQGISEEYYNTLKEQLGDVTVGEYSFADAVDNSNGNVVKNTRLLKLLINQKKKEQKATINAAKSISMLQYSRLVNDMQQAINAMQDEYQTSGMVTDATYENIDALRAQMDALQSTIREYALLELQLSDAANAYKEFEEAQARDAELTYGDSMIEMLQAINEGFLTGKMGTEAFQAAVKALVPPEVYSNIDDLSDRMRAIHDYIDSDKKFADYFTIDDDGNFSITIDNIESFIKDCQEAKLFTDTGLEDFDLSDNVRSVKDFADALGITEAAALAMVTELSKYDASWSNLLRDITSTPMEREFYDTVDAADEATKAMEDFWKAGKDPYGDDANEYKQLCDNLNKTTEAANQSKNAMLEHAKQYAAAKELIAGFNGQIELSADRASYLLNTLGLIDGENPEISFEDGKLVLTEEQVTRIRNLLKETGENDPVVEMQFRYDQVVSDIETVKTYINNLKAGVEQDPITINGVEINNIEDAENTLNQLTQDKETLEFFYKLSPSNDAGGFEKLDEWEANGVNITIKGDTTELDAALSSVYSEGSQPPITLPVKADTTQFDTSMATVTASVATPKTVTVTVTDNGTTDGIQSKVNTLETTKINDKEFDVTSTTLPTAISQVGTLQTKLNNLPTSKTITINIEQNGSIPSGVGGALGNARALGSAHATNKKRGLPQSENSAILGELGPEMVNLWPYNSFNCWNTLKLIKLQRNS